MQVVRETPNPFEHAQRLEVDLRQRLLRVRVLNRAGPPFEAADSERNARQFLADAVVEIAGDARARGLLCVDQTARELPDPAGLLEGSGKHMRHVKFRPGDAINSAALSRLIDEAYSDIKARLEAG